MRFLLRTETHAYRGLIISTLRVFHDSSRDGVEKIIKARWSIEVYHRELKQTCGIERCQARTSRAQRNHICLSIMAWIDKHHRRISEKLSLYQKDWETIKDGISCGIKVIMVTG